jgi:hypothetical protein
MWATGRSPNAVSSSSTSRSLVDGYGDLVTASTDLLDRCGAAADQPAAADAFDRSTRYEIAFWQLAYTRGESDFAVI